MVAVFDVLKAGKEFLGYMIADPAMINSFSFDKILITSIDSQQNIMKDILKECISQSKIVTIE